MKQAYKFKLILAFTLFVTVIGFSFMHTHTAAATSTIPDWYKQYLKASCPDYTPDNYTLTGAYMTTSTVNSDGTGTWYIAGHLCKGAPPAKTPATNHAATDVSVSFKSSGGTNYSVVGVTGSADLSDVLKSDTNAASNPIGSSASYDGAAAIHFNIQAPAGTCGKVTITFSTVAYYPSKDTGHANNYNAPICLAPSNHNPYGSFSVGCTPNGATAIYTVDATWGDSDASPPTSANAQLFGSDNKVIVGASSSPEPTTWHSLTIPESHFPITLRVQDVDGGGDYETVATASRPNCDATGTLTAACTTSVDGTSHYTVSGTYADPDGDAAVPARGYLISSQYGDEGDTNGTHRLAYDLDDNANYDHGSLSWTSTTWPGSYAVQLHVYDVDGGGYEYDEQAAKPNCEPYTRITDSCSMNVFGGRIDTVQASYADADGSSDVYNHARAYLVSGAYGSYVNTSDVNDPDSPTAGHDTRLKNADGSDAFARDDDPNYDHGTITWTGTWDVSATADPMTKIGPHYVYIRVADIQPSGSGNAYQYGGSTAGVMYATRPADASCTHNGTVTCGVSSLSSGSLVAGLSTTFTVTVTVTGAPISDMPSPAPTFGVTVKNAAGVPQTIVPASPVPYDPAASGGSPIVTVYSMPIRFTPATAGSYTINWSWLASGNCGDNPTVGYAPYFKVTGGDVVAGDTFKTGGSTCTPLSGALAANAGIKAWNNDNSPSGNYFGAGTNAAAFALGDIKSFVTASDGAAGISNVGTPVTHPYALSFANSYGPTVNDSGNYGGSYSAYPNCDDDYFTDNYNTDPAHQTPGGTMTLPDPADDTTTSYTGNVTLTGGTLSAGHHLTMVVNGNVFINGDLKYATYATPNDIPSLTIYAKGGIYIAGSVHVIHANLVAQSGPLATCTNGSSSPAGETTDFATCSTKASPVNAASLDIYGSVAAKSVDLDRTYGNYGTLTGPAEQFHYTPETWIPGATGALCDGAGGCKYNAINGLPPVL